MKYKLTKEEIEKLNKSFYKEIVQNLNYKLSLEKNLIFSYSDILNLPLKLRLIVLIEILENNYPVKFREFNFTKNTENKDLKPNYITVAELKNKDEIFSFFKRNFLTHKSLKSFDFNNYDYINIYTIEDLKKILNKIYHSELLESDIIDEKKNRYKYSENKKFSFFRCEKCNKTQWLTFYEAFKWNFYNYKKICVKCRLGYTHYTKSNLNKNNKNKQ